MSTVPVPPRIPGDTVVKTNRLEKEYPDQVIGPYTTWKKVVVAVATANVPTLAGLLIVDTVQLVGGDRVLLTAQTSGVANGIYTASANGWSRADDLQLGVHASGLTVLINQGSASNADSVYICTNAEGADVVGVNSLVFVQLVGLGTTVSGPGSSTNTAIPTWNGTTGTKLNNSTVLLSAGGAITGATIIDSTDNVAANYLNARSLSLVPVTGAVQVSNSAAPATGSILIATSATNATWQPQSALTGIPSSIGFAEYIQTVQGTNSSVAASQANSFLVATPVYTNASIVQSNNTTIGNVWTLAAGTYLISFGMNLSSTGPIGLYVGPAVGSLTFDANTMTGSTVSTTWVQGNAIQTVAAGTVVSVGASVSTAVVAVSGTDAPNFTVRVTFLKIA